MEKQVKIGKLSELMPTVAPTGRGSTSIFGKATSEHLEVVYYRIRPGNMGVYHYHKHSENVWIVLEGELEAIVGGVRHFVRAGEVIFMPNDIPHATGNAGDVDMLAVEIYSPPAGEGPLGAPGKDSYPADLPAVITESSSPSL